MGLNSYFDKIYCINLDRRPDRWQDCLKQFATYNIRDVERFSAYNSPQNGNFGCTRSHRMLLRKIADGPWDRVLVLEDDFHVLTLRDLQLAKFTMDSQVVRTFLSAPIDTLSERFDTMVKHVPDNWDILYLGAGYAEPPRYRVHKHVIRCRGMLTTGSYGVTKKGAQRWSEVVDNATKDAAAAQGIHPFDVGMGAIDSVFCSCLAPLDDYYMYVFQPRLMIQRESKSDLNGETNSYLYSMTDPVHENMV